MEQIIKSLKAIMFSPEIVNDIEFQQLVNSVIIRLNEIITERKKIFEERPSSPCPCGTCES